LGINIGKVCGLQCKNENLCNKHSYSIGKNYMSVQKHDEINKNPYITLEEWQKKEGKLCDYIENDLLCCRNVVSGLDNDLKQFSKCGLHIKF